MEIDVLFTLAIFASTLFGLLVLQASPPRVFGLCLIALLISGLADQALLISSLANPGLLSLVLLIVCSFALEKTHILRLISSKLLVSSYRKSWLRLYLSTVFSSALLNNTAIVATLLSPIKNNPYHAPSKLLLPLSYAAILGGTLTLIGTSTNLIVNSLYVDVAQQSLSFFAFTTVEFCLVVACGLVLWFSHRALPEAAQQPENVKGYFIDAELDPASPMIGHTIEDNGLRHLESLFLVELVRDGRLITPVNPREVLQAGDRLVFSGDVTKVMQLTQFKGLSLYAHTNGLLKTNLSEVVIRHGSVLNGNTLKKVGFRALFDAAVVAIKRDGEKLSGKLGDICLKAGDVLVLAVGDDFIARTNLNKNFVLLSGVEPDIKMTENQSWFTLFGFFTAIALAAFGVMDLLLALVILLGVFLISGMLSVNEITRRLPLEIWLVVGAALLLSQVLINTGTTELLLASLQIDVVSNPWLALCLIYLVTWGLTEFVTNNAAAALMFPIAWSMSLVSGLSPMPFVMTVAFAASACFISPYGYQTNLMVYNAGNYQLRDYLVTGIPVSLVYGLVVLMAVPYFFPF